MPVTLLTDFGTADHFVASMKGVILARSPQAPIVDITHEIPPQDVQAGAFTLLAAYPAFPPGTVHVGVVDPGVGSARRPIVAAAGEHRFVGPDNGLFGYVYQREPDLRVYHLRDERFFRSPVSATFHGRDIFAPVAGALAAGVAPAELGEEIADFVRLPPLAPGRTAEGALLATILHVDRFGNCITSVTRDDLTEEMRAHGIRLEVGGHEIRSLRRFFAEEGNDRGGAFAIWGSAGFLEIALDRDSAARWLGVRRGEPVTVRASAG